MTKTRHFFATVQIAVISSFNFLESAFDRVKSVLEGFAEYFSLDLAEKVNRGLTENALKCKFNGGNPTIGYIIDQEQYFQIDPVKAPFVLDAFKMYDEGSTMSEIRDHLNEHNVLNNRGKPHTINSVAKILKNRRYIGEYKYRDIVVPNGIPAIVPVDLFERVQEKIEKNKKAPARHKAEEITCSQPSCSAATVGLTCAVRAAEDVPVRSITITSACP